MIISGIKLLDASGEPWDGSSGSQKQIVVLASGGVDSGAAMLLLQQAGWEILALTMKVPVLNGGADETCGTEAADVCGKLGIPHYFVEVREAFERLVVGPFRQAYADGRTPSPCVDCNTHLKLGLMWEFAENQFGIKRLATGHYARVVHRNGGSFLTRASDTNRDQSYFLYGVSRQRLPDLVLPLGDLRKDEVRKIAETADLPIAQREDSMELCFAGGGDYRTALGGESGSRGPILDSAGNTIGEHRCIENYTVGQRRGLRIAAREALYVISIDPVGNSITVGPEDEAYKHEVRAQEINVLVQDRFADGQKLYGKIRSQGDPAPCSIEDADAWSLAVRFEQAQFAPTPGQHLVLYDADGTVIGGGTIC